MSQHELSEEQARGIAVRVVDECARQNDASFIGWNGWHVAGRDRFIALVRAGYAAANLAEAERKGAREVAEWVLDYWQKNLTVHGSGYGADRNADGGQVGVFTRKLRSYLAAPAPEGVTLTCVVCGLSDKGVVPFATATGEPGHPDRDTCIGALGAALRAKVGAA